MNLVINEKNEFYKNASQQNKAYRLEAFCFTHDFGLNIMFNDMDDLNEIIADLEIEFWQVEDNINHSYVNVNNFDDLETVLEWLDDSEDQSNIDQYVEIKKGGYADSLESAKEWHEENHHCEFKEDYDFGYDQIHESGLEIPEWMEGYFDYEKYGRDLKINDYIVIGNGIYNNR